MEGMWSVGGRSMDVVTVASEVGCLGDAGGYVSVLW